MPSNTMRFGAVGIWILIFSALGTSQVTTGTVLGTVSDSSDAVITGATINLRNIETGITRTVQSGSSGRYRAPQLALGGYEVSAEAQGFQTVVRTGITLTVGQEAVVDFTLPVGSVNEKVTVTGEAPAIEVTNSTVSSVVEGYTVRELPLNGRSFDQLTLLQPGVFMAKQSGTGAPGFGGSTTWISIAGARPTQSITLYDGTNINNFFNYAGSGVSGKLLGVDAIREFRVLTNNYSAEYGRAVGGVTNIVTRTGTNDLHGSVFEFLRNSAMDAKNFFDLATEPIPAFRRNQFGGSIGGPLRKDRTFFFATYEGLRDRLGKTSVAGVPTLAARDGHLPTGDVTIIGAVRPFLALYPKPNGPELGNGIAQLTTSATQPTNENFGQVRLDHQLTGNESLFGRYTIDRAEMVDPYATQIPGFPRAADAGNQYATIQLNSILSSVLLNTARFGYTRVGHETIAPEQPDILRFGLPYSRVGALIVTGMSNMGVGTATGNLHALRNLFEYSDDLSLARGNHSFKFGAVVERFRDFFFYDFLVTGEQRFNNLSDFLNNRPASFRGSLPGADPKMQWRQYLFGFYAQDDYNVRPGLTLNLGIRYEFVNNPINVIQRPNIGGKFGIIKDTLRDTTFSLTEHPFADNPSLRNFAPRFGFAWDVFGDGKTAFRGGFGLAYDQILANYYAFWFDAPPLLSSVRGAGFAFPNPFPSPTTPLIGTNEPTDYLTSSTPTTLQYNLNFQRQMPWDLAVQIGYAGKRGIHQGTGRDTNTPFPTISADGQYSIPTGAPHRNPNFAELGLRYFAGNSWYNSLQLGLQKRLKKGFMVTTNYTWSRSIDDYSGVRNGEGLSGHEGIQNPDCLACDRGVSEFNRSHVFNATYSYQLPFGKNTQGLPGQLLKGWEVSGITTMETGLPLSAYVGFDRPGLLTVSSTLAVRPNLQPGMSNNPTEGLSAGCPGINAGRKLGDPSLWFDPCAFALQPAGQFGNLGRDTIVGPKLINFDFSLVKNTSLGEERSLQFRTEFFNIFNHPNFGGFGFGGGNVFTSATGTASAGGARITSTNTTARQIQFSLKLSF